MFELGVARFVQLCQRRVRLHRGFHAHQSAGGLAHAGELPAGHHGQQRGAVARALFGGHNVQRDAQHVCQDGPPQGGLRPAAADTGTRDGKAQAFRHLKGIADGKRNALQHGLRHVGAGGVHGHADECGAGVCVVDGAALSHQVGQEEHVVFAQLLRGDLPFLALIVRGADDLILPPFVAGRGREHAAHQMPAAVRVGKGVQAVGGVHAEFARRDEDGARGAQGDVAVAVAHRARTHGGRRVVAGTGAHHNALGQAQCRRSLRQQRADGGKTLVQARHLRFG